jgi:mRNA interferase RelE/StbE
MAWTIELAPDVKRGLKKLDRQTSNGILKFLHERIAPLENPRQIGEALQGSRLGNFWKYRVGDYRIIASIEDQQVRILVVRVDNRREVYR